MSALPLAAAASLGLATTALLLAIFLPLAHRWALVDEPGAHKTHAIAVPTLGGPAIVAGLLAGALSAGLGAQAWLLLLAMLGLLAVGMSDDRLNLSPLVRFVAQIIAALAMIWGGGVLLVDFGELLLPGRVLPLAWLAIPATVFCAVGVMNASNMIDGMDGLAGGLVMIVFLGLAVLAWQAGNDVAARFAAVLAACVAGFLVFNLRFGARAARVYLGNGGSLALGMALAWLLVGLSQGPSRAYAPVTALWLFAVPLVDTVSVLWRRMAAGRSPFDADHQHAHHLLQRAGYGVNASLALLLGAQIAGMVIGVGLERAGLPQPLSFATFLALALLIHRRAARAAGILPAWGAARAS